MNILFISNIVTPYQLDFLKELNLQENVDVYGYFLYAKEQNREWSLDLPDNICIANYSKKTSDYIRLYKFIKNHKINKLIVGGYSLPMTFFTIIVSKFKNIDLFFWLERPINEQKGLKKYLKELYLKITLGYANKIFAIGKLAVKRYSKYHNTVLNLPYNMNLYKFYNIARDNKPKDKLRFLFSGQYIDRKNIINTINAFKKIQNDDIELNLIGGGELQEEVSNLIKNDSRINDIGFVQPQELYNIYETNNIFLMPSKHDGWALVINEAMASSMPIISTNKVGAVVEYVKHKENGYICDLDKNSIEKGILFYIHNQDKIYEHGLKNKELIKSSIADVKNAVRCIVNEL